MTFKFSNHSLLQLSTVQPYLRTVVTEALRLTVSDFIVFEGARTIEKQREYVRTGVSKTMTSKHLPQEDGYSWAVDLVPWIAGGPRWEWEPIYNIAKAMHRAEHNIASANQPAKDIPFELFGITWGGVWDLPLKAIGNPKLEVDKYAKRIKQTGRNAFIDGPHFELRRTNPSS